MTNQNDFVLTTPRLGLRDLRQSDLDGLNVVFSDPEVNIYDGGAKPPAWVQEWLDARIAERHAHPEAAAWGVVLNGSTIGYCGLFHMSDLNGEPAIALGYRLARAYWGKGYATEAAVAVRDYAFESLGLERLVATIDPGNANSIRVAEKIGMRLVGEVMYAGYTHPDNVYAILNVDRRSCNQ